jgi:hypothetical protein
VSVWGGSLFCGINLGDMGGWAASFPICVTLLLLCPHAFVRWGPSCFLVFLVTLALPVEVRCPVIRTVGIVSGVVVPLASSPPPHHSPFLLLHDNMVRGFGCRISW